MIADPTAAAPVEIDTELARLGGENADARRAMGWAVDKLMNELKVERTRARGSLSTWSIPADEAITRAQAMVDAPIEPCEYPAVKMHAIARLQKMIEEIATTRKRAADIEAETRPLEAEYRRRPWQRAFLAVTNGRGHVHRTMWCSTCNRGKSDTAFHWMVAYSGMAEAEIVNAAGERACTVCYPSAPVEALARPTTMFSPDEIAAAAAREQRADEKAKRDRIKIEKALTIDGSEFRVEYDWGTNGRTGAPLRNREYFRTAAAATQWWVGETIRTRTGYGPQSDNDKASHKAALDSVVAALVAKRGLDEAVIRAELEEKIAKRLKREHR